MVFSRPFSEKEIAYIIQWQYTKLPGTIAQEMNKWPENSEEPRKTESVRLFLYRRRKQQAGVPLNEDNV